MEKINIGEQGYALSMPQAILGTHFEGRPNYMALCWVSRVNFKPATRYGGSILREVSYQSGCFPGVPVTSGKHSEIHFHNLSLHVSGILATSRDNGKA